MSVMIVMIIAIILFNRISYSQSGRITEPSNLLLSKKGFGEVPLYKAFLTAPLPLPS